MAFLDVTWEITLVGLGSLLAGIGSLLAGLAALRRANTEPPKQPPVEPDQEPKETDWVEAT
jgi:hypothetical protein